jgi:hypothetical protein
MEDKEFIIINNLIDENSKTLVGTLLKRFENLEGNNLTFEQAKSIYLKIIKDLIYENSRYLKKLISATLNTGQIIFKPPQK